MTRKTGKTAAICASVLISSTAFANNGDQMVGYSAIANAMGGRLSPCHRMSPLHSATRLDWPI